MVDIDLTENGMRNIVLIAILICLNLPGSKANEDYLGTYFQGTGLTNFYLTLSLGNRYSLKIRQDAWGEETFEGSYTVEKQIINLSPIDSRRTLVKTHPKQLNIVIWGDRYYLLSDGELLDFCNSVNLGFEPRNELTGSFYMKVGDENLQTKGTPGVPDHWKSYIFIKSVRGKIIKMLTGKQARINIGSDDGLQINHELYVQNPLGQILGMVSVTKLYQNFADVTCTYGDELHENDFVGNFIHAKK